ncbi:MAG: transposase [Verrucomicrobiota bacterium]|jgi:hypothetical protein
MALTSEIHDLVRELQQSEISIADFARKVGIHPVTVRAWVRDVSKGETGDASATRFVPVRLRHAPQAPTHGPSAEVVSPTGWRLSFPMAIDPRHLSQLIDILRRC